MTPREVLVTALRDALPSDVHLEPYARDGLTPAKQTVMVAMDEVNRTSAAPLAQRLYTFKLVLVVPSQDVSGKADDKLDALLEDVLYAVEKAPDLPQWTSALRATYDQRFPAYEVTVPVTYQITNPE